MKKYSAIQIPFLSFYSKALYREACFEWKGTGFAYLFLLLAVCWIPAMVKYHIMFSNYTRKEAPGIISQIPQIAFSNGVASVEVPQPHSIKDPKTQKILIVIDTTGKINSLKDTEAFGLVTKSEAIFRKSDVESRSFNYKSLDQFTLNQQKIARWLEIARKYWALIFYPLAVTGSFVFRIVQLLLYAAIGILFASWCRSKRSYDSLLRISALAVTPGIIINTILEVAGINVPLAGLWFFLVAMIFLFIGVQESAKDVTPPTENLGSERAAEDSQQRKWF
jgi:hypothetical protein